MILQRLFSLLILTCWICLSSCPGTLEMRNAKISMALPLKVQDMKSGSFQRPPLHLNITQNVTLTVSLAVGSPPQTVTMVLDTGSQLSYLRCNATQIKQPVFYPNMSQSYSPVPCSSARCSSQPQETSIIPTCDSSKSCNVGIFYADSSFLNLTLAEDMFSIAGSNLKGTVFGCLDPVSSTNSDEDSKTTGLMGMNRGSLSFVSQMDFPKFSYCISSSDDSGLLVLGESGFSNFKHLNYTPMNLSLSHDELPSLDKLAYTVNLEGIKVSDKLLNLSKSVFEADHTGTGQPMLDSGTQFTYLRGQAYTALREEFLKQTKGILEQYPDYVFQGAMDLCFRVGSNQTSLSMLPSVTLLLEGAEIEIPGNRLLYQDPGDVSIHCFTFGNSELLGTEANIIGHYQQQNLWVEYDLINSRIGFAHFPCNFSR